MMMGALANRALRASFIDHLVDFATANGFAGIDLEIGSIDDPGMRRYEEFIGELHRAFAPAGLTLAVTVALDDPDYHPDVLARAADFVIINSIDVTPSATMPAPLQPQQMFANALAANRGDRSRQDRRRDRQFGLRLEPDGEDAPADDSAGRD
jgi:hypothetical protein